MPTSLVQVVKNELRSLLELKKSERLWHIPVLASLCVGIPLLIGLYFNRIDYGILACTGGMVILYLPSSNSVAHRMITLVACSFGLAFSFAVSIAFSFNPIVSSLVLGLIAFAAHWVTRYFQMKPPGGFFFVMIAAIASSMQFDFNTIPTRIGLIVMSGMLACVLAFFYSLYIIRKGKLTQETVSLATNPYTKLVESIIIAIVLTVSLLVSHLLKLEKPYWVPISCAAVMQGISLHHVWQRSIQRILGTFIGLGVAWLLLQFEMTALTVCISIMLLQFIVEMLIVRHYGLAVILITPLTLFLAEAGSAMNADPNYLIATRLLDTVIGSVLGLLGGWFLHNQQVRESTERRIRKTRVAILRR